MAKIFLLILTLDLLSGSLAVRDEDLNTQKTDTKVRVAYLLMDSNQAEQLLVQNSKDFNNRLTFESLGNTYGENEAVNELMFDFKDALSNTQRFTGMVLDEWYTPTLTKVSYANYNNSLGRCWRDLAEVPCLVSGPPSGYPSKIGKLKEALVRLQAATQKVLNENKKTISSLEQKKPQIDEYVRNRKVDLCSVIKSIPQNILMKYFTVDYLRTHKPLLDSIDFPKLARCQTILAAVDLKPLLESGILAPYLKTLDLYDIKAMLSNVDLPTLLLTVNLKYIKENFNRDLLLQAVDVQFALRYVPLGQLLGNFSVGDIVKNQPLSEVLKAVTTSLGLGGLNSVLDSLTGPKGALGSVLSTVSDLLGKLLGTKNNVKANNGKDNADGPLASVGTLVSNLLGSLLGPVTRPLSDLLGGLLG